MGEWQRLTRLLHEGEGVSRVATPLVTPIYESTTFVFDSAAEVQRYNEGRSTGYLYSRYANPTVVAVEAKLAALERAETALIFASGMAATATTLLTLLAPGDELVCSAALYGGTRHLLDDVLVPFGIRARPVTLVELNRPADVLGDETRVLWFESPTNPTLRCVDIRAVASACRAAGVMSMIDNTFASPINQQPLALGVDLVMESATKYLNGHSDVVAGVVAGPRALLDRIDRRRRLLGTVLDPLAAYALGRGLKTLPVRIAQHNRNAQAVAEFLAQDQRVAEVQYPGLSSHPEYELARAQMSGGGGMVCLDLAGGLERASRFFDRLSVFKRAASLGGVESLCSLPVLTSHWGFGEAELARAGVSAGMVRLSVGLEAVEDLIADLDQALG